MSRFKAHGRELPSRSGSRTTRRPGKAVPGLKRAAGSHFHSDGVTPKVVHLTQSGAREAADRNEERDGKSWRAYKCRQCLGWHLSASLAGGRAAPVYEVIHRGLSRPPGTHFSEPEVGGADHAAKLVAEGYLRPLDAS